MSFIEHLNKMSVSKKYLLSILFKLKRFKVEELIAINPLVGSNNSQYPVDNLVKKLKKKLPINRI